jgi:hypothetical protein
MKMDKLTSEDRELLQVIGDFLEQGLAENIAAMFRQDPSLHRLTGQLLRDQRFMVRMGVAVLYEELAVTSPADLPRAIPALKPLLSEPTAIHPVCGLSADEADAQAPIKVRERCRCEAELCPPYTRYAG